MKELIEQPDPHQEYGRTSDIDPSALGWLVLLAGLGVWAWRSLNKQGQSLQDTLGALAVIVVLAVIVLVSLIGNFL